jgi:hypothetical protein
MTRFHTLIPLMFLDRRRGAVEHCFLKQSFSPTDHEYSMPGFWVDSRRRTRTRLPKERHQAVTLLSPSQQNCPMSVWYKIQRLLWKRKSKKLNIIEGREFWKTMSMSTTDREPGMLLAYWRKGCCGVNSGYGERNSRTEYSTRKPPMTGDVKVGMGVQLRCWRRNEKTTT